MPQSWNDPRPNNEPYFIDSTCSVCGTELELLDKFSDDVDMDKLDDGEDDDVIRDEWVCPNVSCDVNGVYLDVPDRDDYEGLDDVDDVELESIKLEGVS